MMSSEELSEGVEEASKKKRGGRKPAVPIKKERRFFTPEDKAAIMVKAMTSPKPTEIMRQAGLHPNVFYRWRQVAIEGMTKALSGMDVEPSMDDAGCAELRAENDRLKREVGDLYMKLKEADRQQVSAYAGRADENVEEEGWNPQG